MSAHRAHWAARTRTPLTRRAQDAKFLGRTLQLRWFNERETELITALVRRYHAAVYCDINEILHARSALATATLLENHEYLLQRVGGPHDDGIGPTCLIVYRDVPEALCALRAAPLRVRRRAVAAVEFRLYAATVALDLPDGHFALLPEDRAMPAEVLHLAARHHSRIPELVATIAAGPGLTLASIDAGVSDGVQAQLLEGAL